MCANLKSNQSETSQLRIFMDGLIDKFKISKESSLYFPQVIYLKLDLIEEIFVSLETTFKNSSLFTRNFSNFINSSLNNNSFQMNASSNFPIKIKIEKKHEAAKSKGFTYASKAYDASFNIVIDNDEDLKYARNLLGLYTHLIKPYLKENEEVLRSVSERSTRFLYIDLCRYSWLCWQNVF